MEWTVTATRDDYQRAAYELGVQIHVIAVASGVLIAGAAASAIFGQWIGAALLAGMAVAGLAYSRIGLRQSLRRLPRSAFDPVIFRASQDGLEVETADLRQFSRWSCFTELKQTPIAWYFVGPGQATVPLFRRGLSENEDASVKQAVEQFAPQLLSAQQPSAA